MAAHLPRAREVLAVIAHPDDESFGLGAVLGGFGAQGTQVRVLCFTHGEASTLGQTERNLGALRGAELAAAAEVLGVEHVQLLAYPDGGLAQVPLDELTQRVLDSLAGADVLIAFDDNGITGHPDHRRATEAAVAAGAASGIPVLAWALPQPVADRLNAEFGAAFGGRDHDGLDVVIEVDRTQQRAAINCHASQSRDNPVLWRRLDVQGNREYLRWLEAVPGGQLIRGDDTHRAHARTRNLPRPVTASRQLRAARTQPE
ncbi:PIG-L family deacetylase [Mycobacterium riyadhense]|uniref:Mycothiol S-conjugate amidase n=1 Tax=Mycobacterium riyadhense TaxID=486698 RepID=A0A653EVV7_9MYCO|nr:PIG-L family deacetylase [Mycobacterium riyadhense]VTP01587.1 Mycothiol S-conjugate amidase [Mycobacterium riyadhense]